MFFFIGFGCLVPGVTFVLALCCELTVEFVMNDDQYYQTAGWPLASVFVVSAVINAIAFFKIYWPDAPESLQDDDGNDIVPEPAPGWLDHSFILINLGAWVPILIGCAIHTVVTRGW